MPALAQTPPWTAANVGGAYLSGSSIFRAAAIDASGNVFVVGNFNGQLTLGNTTLTTVGATDVYVAKYVPSTGTWAWAQSGGGTNGEGAIGIAVSGSNVYVCGTVLNDLADSNAARFGGTGPATHTTTVRGASTSTNADMLLLKYVDQGSSARLAWAQVGGGTGSDYANGVAVSGSSVYITGYLFNTSANANAAVFGGNGTTPGTAVVNGLGATAANDILLAKYTDNGPSATLAWTQVAGGTSSDSGFGVAASGSSVYVTGSITNNTANTNGVVFGGNGSTPGTAAQAGAAAGTTIDAVLAKYTDNGATATFRWSQVAGGTSSDLSQGVAVSGTNVYLATLCTNNTANANAVVFGGTGLAAGTTPQYGATATASVDIVVAKYVDNGATGTLGWTQVGGGTSDDQPRAIAASGSRVYVGGYVTASASPATFGVVFGGAGTVPGPTSVAGMSANGSKDIVLAEYTDQGSSATFDWAQVGGGSLDDYGIGAAASATSAYVVGYVTSQASFGPFTVGSGQPTVVNVLAGVAVTPLATAQPAASAARLTLWPNPAGPGRVATLGGTAPGAAVQVLDVLGRAVLTTAADVGGQALLRLPEGLAPGVYLVRSSGQATRLLVE